MPWFALDDGFDTHPKVRKAGNAAAGLFTRLGAHCAKHLTEGKVDAEVVRDYGTPAQVRKLVEVGMLHPVGHDCPHPKCQQPAPGGYYLHDFLDYNKSRKQIEAAREAGRQRQQKGRDHARDDRKSRDSRVKRDANARENGASFAPNGDENEGLFPEGTAGQGDMSRRDTLQGATGVPSPPIPSGTPYGSTSSPTPSSHHSSDVVPASSGRGEIQPLIDAMVARGMNVTWTFHGSEWVDLRDAVRRVGINDLVDYAARSWQAARDKPHSARYFLRGWIGLQAAAPGFTPPPSKGQSYLAQMAAHAERLRDQTGGA
ncbi:mucin-2 [Streptomyces sp. NPDC056488]|uniref:mucin-2 n=1 Tax=Streptomyces sp. NPDC056488 TaxID=3345836 RepID=UPI0036A473A9